MSNEQTRTGHWVVCNPDDPTFPIELAPGQSIVELVGCCVPLDAAIAELFSLPPISESAVMGDRGAETLTNL